MAWHDIEKPIVGKFQIVHSIPNAGRTLIDLQTYLLDLQDNLNVPKVKNIKFINGVVGETMTIPVATANNATTYNNEALFFQDVTFPTNGLQQIVITTPTISAPIHVMLQATMTCVVAQASVFPAIAVKTEIFNTSGNGQTSNGVGGLWELVPNYSPPFYWSGGSAEAIVANAVRSIGMYFVIPNTQPNTQYRFTAQAGIGSNSVAFPQTGQYKIDAVGTNTFEFVVWVGG